MAENLIDALRCPISGIIMNDPVVLCSSGVSYERTVIENWLIVHGTDPVSGEPLQQDVRLIQNTCLRALIAAIMANVET